MRIRILGLLLGFLATAPLSAAITGTLMNGDGVPIAGAKVTIAAPETLDAHRERLLAKSDRTPLATTQSDAKGAFKLEPPANPTVDLRVEAKGYAPFGVLVERDGEVPVIVLRKADLKSGKITAGGKPVAGAIVVWSGSTEVLATTDAEGRYSVPDPAKWAYRLTIVHPDFAVYEQWIMMMSDSMQKSLDRTLDAGTAISGRVTGSDGQTPIAKAAVSADGWPFATTADDGTFTIAHASKKPENVTARSGNLQAVRGANGANTNFRLGKPSSLNGTLRDAKTRAPIAGAVVSLSRGMRFNSSLVASTVTDAKGNYAFPMLTSGSYELEAEHPSYEFNSITADVTAGQSVNRSFSAPPLARISGVVIDDEKRPIAAAVVSVAEDPSFNFRMRGQMRRRDGFWSGPDGRFLLLTSDEDDVALKARKKGLPSSTPSSVKIAAGERKSGVVITIPRGLEVAGRVVDHDGRPLSGVTVSAAESTGGMRGMFFFRPGAMSGDDEDVVRSASDGTFAIRLTEGTYDLSFKREGFAMKAVRAHRVASGVKPIEVVLEPGVEITGRVTRGGAPLEGVMVMMPMGGSSSSNTTGPDGTFRIADLTPGTVMVTFMKPDDFVQEMRNFTAPARDVVIDLPRGGRMSGRVFDKATRQPVTAFQAGISTSRGGGGMTIMTPPILRSVRSDDGSFTLENVPSGLLQLVVSAPGYTTAKLSNLSLEEGKSIDGVEVAMETGTRITGRVTDPSGNAVGGATVRIETVAQRRMGFRMPGGGDPEAMTDDSGEYTLEAVESGEKTFSAEHSGFLSAQKTADVTGREQRIDFQLSKGSSVRGQVLTAAGVPVGDAEVSASSAAGGRDRAKTDASGLFTLENLAPGHYAFSANKQGVGHAELTDVDITAGAPIRLVMQSGGTIYGHVTGLTQAELSSASIDAYGNDSNASAPVDSSGSFRIEGAPTGTVRVSASVMRNFGERKTSPSKTIQLEGGATQQVDLEFRSDVAITGRVTRNGRAQANATVSFNPRSSMSQTRATVPTNENGEYTVTGLDDGTYGVTVMDMQRLNPYSTTYDVRGSGTFDIDVKVTPVRGRVIDSQTNEPIADARIQLRPASQTESMLMMRGASTDANGAFSIDSVTPGRYVVTADKEKYGNDTREISVSETSADDVELKLARNPGVLLRVVDARDNRALIANVVVFDLQGRVVDDSFRFSFGSNTAEALQLKLAPGQYRASVAAMGYAARTINITSPGDLTVGLTPGGKLMIRSSRSTPLSARLIDTATGQPYFLGGMARPEFPLNAAPGVTNAGEITAGTYTLEVLDKNSVVVDTKQVTIVDGQTTTIDV
ncbi:MAG TPA: carboxypeptidase regulatory-like domain-containing protein [Thermoanaerobaculia bacterium]|nr:carboxypeptidase regulatory-like domain-containing protein [Thermoanaerobaculia bacterium]